MACDNCDCYDCRVDRGEIEDCNRGWLQAQRSGRYVNNFGQFRAWLTETGYARFQYNPYGSDNDSDDWQPLEGDECCFDGTFSMLHQMPEFQSNLEVWARRRYWRSPEDFQALQEQYRQDTAYVRQQVQQELTSAREAYSQRYEQWRLDDQELRDQLNTARAELEALRASQDNAVTLTVLHEQVAD